jgi:LacI family transcriptional regulator
MAAGALAAAHGAGIKIPRQLSVAGFDDTPVATTVWPELTTVHQPIAEMAARSVEILAEQVRRIRAGESPEPVQEIAACEIVARGSIAPPARER